MSNRPRTHRWTPAAARGEYRSEHGQGCLRLGCPVRRRQLPRTLAGDRYHLVEISLDGGVTWVRGRHAGPDRGTYLPACTGD